MMKKLVLLGFSLMLCTYSAEAQFFKKLKEKVQKKVEHVVTENIANKAANEANNSLNKMWETDLKNIPIPMGANRVDISEVPARYQFDWEYQLNMETSEGNMDMTYLLNQDKSYFGMKVSKAEGLYMVLDMEKKLSVMYLSSGKNNFITASKIENLDDYESEDNPYENSTLKKIGTKSILGYSCQGYQTEKDGQVLTFYVTREAPVSMVNMYSDEKSNIPKGWNANWFEDGDVLMMEMEMVDQSKPESNIVMRCTGLEKKSFNLNKGDYASLGSSNE